MCHFSKCQIRPFNTKVIRAAALGHLVVNLSVYSAIRPARVINTAQGRNFIENTSENSDFKVMSWGVIHV